MAGFNTHLKVDDVSASDTRVIEPVSGSGFVVCLPKAPSWER